ncbi:MAG: efflux RND transporter periplasmic adaptor subunit, partial [Clostridia bacterium]|nr:efflux RND transporter periplasmic adaptor subunit [Clostridia bacterium]
MKFSLKKLLSPKDSSDSATGRKKFSKKRMRIVAFVLVAIIAALGFFSYRAFWSGDKSKGGEITAIASIGTVSSVIEGSGTISALQQYEITSLKKGEVVADYFEEGDIVNEGDVLYLMDDTDGYDAIDNASSSVKRAQRNYT